MPKTSEQFWFWVCQSPIYFITWCPARLWWSRPTVRQDLDPDLRLRSRNVNFYWHIKNLQVFFFTSLFSSRRILSFSVLSHLLVLSIGSTSLTGDDTLALKPRTLWKLMYSKNNFFTKLQTIFLSANFCWWSHRHASVILCWLLCFQPFLENDIMPKS